METEQQQSLNIHMLKDYYKLLEEKNDKIADEIANLKKEPSQNGEKNLV